MGLFIYQPPSVNDGPRQISIDFAGIVTMDARDELTVTSYPGSSFQPPACSKLTVTSSSIDTLYCTNLGDTGSIVFQDCALLTTIDMAEVTALNATEVVISNANLVTGSVDAVLNALAAGSGENGVVNLSGGFNVAPSEASLAARTELAARGWTITTA